MLKYRTTWSGSSLTLWETGTDWLAIITLPTPSLFWEPWLIQAEMSSDIEENSRARANQWNNRNMKAEIILN
jgi:hypothetical protein